jgi:hypothetical protein
MQYKKAQGDDDAMVVESKRNCWNGKPTTNVQKTIWHLDNSPVSVIVHHLCHLVFTGAFYSE